VAKTENSAENSKGGAPQLDPYKWQKGQSGNPGGRPKKKPVTDLYDEILNDPEEIAKIRASVIKSLVKGNMAMVLQLREMTDRVEGKVTQPIEADITVNLADAIAEARKRAGR
jgi:hypothetical protein